MTEIFVALFTENYPSYRLDVSYQVCLWDQSQVPIVWNTRETGNIYYNHVDALESRPLCYGPV